MPQAQDFMWTWNLLVSNLLIPLCLALLWYAIKRQFTKKDEKDKQIEEMKESAILEWRTRFSTTQCSIKEKLDEMSKDLNNKVDWTFCHDKEEEISRKIDRLDDRIRV
jgi:flagellar biosynthesis/type III secretory pathway M-ring protein FliF/YscJ